MEEITVEEKTKEEITKEEKTREEITENADGEEASGGRRPHRRTAGKKRKGFRFLDFLIGMVFLAGVGIMAYPTVSDWINQRRMTGQMKVYSRSVEELTPEQIEEALRIARAYNRELKKNPNPWSEKSRTPGYRETLNVDKSGIMGYVTIEKIRVRLPFYHGTEEDVLDTAIGHLEGSSIPIGDKGEHAVLSAHRGLPSAKLFTDLPEMQTGDRFVITVLDREMEYEVDQVLTVLPDSAEAFEALKCREGEDLCTLMTCTPYGVNTHRLLVRGKRVE